MSKEGDLDRPALIGPDRTERELSDLDQNMCISEEYSIQENSVAEYVLHRHKSAKSLPSNCPGQKSEVAEYVLHRHKTAKSLPSNCLGQKSENRYKLKNSQTLTLNRRTGVDLKGRMSPNFDEFNTPHKNTIVLQRCASFHGKSNDKIFILRRSTSMSIPRSIDIEQFVGIEQSILPSPPFSVFPGSRSESVDLRGRMSPNFDKFNTPHKNTIVLQRCASFHGKSNDKIFILRRSTSMSIPRSIDIEQFVGIEQSILPSPPFSVFPGSRSESVDLRGRMSPNFDKFNTPHKNTMVLQRCASFHCKSNDKIFILRRSTSMSIPRSIDIEQFVGIEQSILPSPPFSVSPGSRSDSTAALSECELDQVDNLKQTSQNDDLLINKNSKLALDESEIEIDEPVSPEIANFAVAVQGVDIYNLDTKFVPYDIEEKKNNPQPTQSNLWYTKPYLNDYVRKRISEHESDGNVSPISQPNDESKSDGRISPVSMVSSMEMTFDQEVPSRSRHKHFTSISETPDNQLNLSAPLTSNPVTTPPKYHAHSINSRSSSRSHKVKAVFSSEENALGQFDQLIKSDQTIQYTLTPETVRDVEAPDHHQRFNRKNSEHGSILVNKASSSSSKYVTIDTSQTKTLPTKANSVRTSESNSKPSSVTEVRQRSGAPQPRDARIERDRSLSDFAKFIRSTGPDVSVQNKPSSYQKISLAENQEYTGSYLEKHSSSRSMLHKRLDSASTRIKFPGREIMAKRSDSFSGFIDFVRPVPKLELPLSFTSQEQATSDSPTLSNRSCGISESKNSDGSLVEPRQWQNPPSINSSVTSHSALLVNSLQNGPSIMQSRKQFNDKSKISTRKVRKIRDPYSIDFLDEEDGVESSLESKPKQSESLKDFLRNTSPTDILEENLAGNTTKANQSIPGLMSLFGRPPASPQSSSKGFLGSIVSHQSAANLSGAKKSTISRPAQSSSIISRVNMPRANISHKHFEPRDATSRVRTDELAKFLMRNDPPSLNVKNSPIPILLTRNPKNNIQDPPKNEAGSFQRIFSRKRTSTLSKS